jgi:hypothetical protein
MRKFVIGTLIGAGLMYWYLGQGRALLSSGENKLETVGSQYRGDAHKRRADDALR